MDDLYFDRETIKFLLDHGTEPSNRKCEGCGEVKAIAYTQTNEYEGGDESLDICWDCAEKYEAQYHADMEANPEYYT